MSQFLSKAAQPLVVVLGPTASGKTDFSLHIAEEMGSLGKKAEVVNADSRQLYRKLNIGTAKITPEEMKGTPHHLLDVLDVKDPVTIAWYKHEAMNTIDRTQMQGSVPLLVGGSMLYISAIVDGLEPLPAVDPDLRQELEAKYDKDEGKSLYAKLQMIDPLIADSIEPKNRRYLVRAMELIEATGKTITEQRRTSSSPYDLLVIGMQWPREALVERINKRTDLLFDRGWVEEVEGLKEAGYQPSDPGMQSHGYREILEWIDKGKPEDQKDALKEAIAANTRQYAKRQMTWWKHDPRIQWVEGTK